MGWEYYITLKDKQYEQAIDALYKAFEEYGKHDIIKKDEGFYLNNDNYQFSEILCIEIHIAKNINDIVADDEKYIYILFYVGGEEAYNMIQTIKITLDDMGLQYIFDDM